MECTLSVAGAVKKFVDSNKKKYKGRRLIHGEQLLCCRSEKLVTLELVERERLQPSEQRGSGDNKVIRTPLAYADLFKVESGKKEIKTILIDGDAGIGKSTFCTSISEKWANGEIFQEFELVLLLPLREQEVASAGSLLDLLKVLHPSNKICELVKEYFEEDEGKFLVIADGWDELNEEKRKEGLFLYKFLFGAKYSSTSTVVTSRPFASAPLHRHTCIDRFAEIRGFDKEHIEEYINSEFDKKKASQLLEKLESNPLIESICSVPLNCVIICHLWRELEGDLPTTMTRLYTVIILNIINRNIRRRDSADENTLNLQTFDDIPETLQESWWLLCEFAFQTLKKDQLVFSDKELKHIFRQELSLGNDILCFGLLQSSVAPLVVGCGRSYHFLHLTFQEYLAALYLVKQECSAVTVANSLIPRLTTLFKVPMEQDFDSDGKSDSIILWFFFGIVYTFELFQSSIGQRVLTALTDLDEHHSPHELVLCHWAFEAHNEQFVHIVANRLYGCYPCPNTIHDFAVVVYVIANTPKCTDASINLYGCNLHDSHIMTLTDALASKDGKLQVKELDLRKSELTDRGITDLFHRASAAFQSLECLDLEGFRVSYRISGKCIDLIVATVAKSLNEVKFSFGNNPLEVPSLTLFRDALCHHQLSSLTELSLTGSLSSNADKNAEFVLALSHCHSLRDLDLSDNNLHAPGGRALGKVLPQLSLERFDVSSTRLGDEGMAALTQSLDGACHIGDLDLSNNAIHAAGISCLADSVCEGKMVIEEFLCLIHNPIGLKGTVALVRLLSSKHFRAYNVLLEYCELTTAEDDNTRSISPRLDESITCVGIREQICRYEIKFNSVTVLHLGGSNFSGEGIHLLAGFMYLCPQLVDLNCGDCEITSDDLKQLLLLLPQPNLYLEYWYLSRNMIDDDGVSVLIEHLPVFPSLSCIDIHKYMYDNISQGMLTTLKEICESRKEFQTQWKEIVDCLVSKCLSPTQFHLEIIENVEHDSQDSSIVPLEHGSEIAVHHEETGHIPSEAHPLQEAIEAELVNFTNKSKSINAIVAEDYLMEAAMRLSLCEQMEDFSDSEDFHTPPSSPSLDQIRKPEEENRHSYMEIIQERVTEEFEETAFDEESTAVVAEVVDTAVDPDRMTITEPHLQIHQKVRQVETIVAEGLISHGRIDRSSKSEDYLTPPPSPAQKRTVKLQEDGSKQSTPEVRATNRMSSIEEATQSRTVAGEEVNLLHPIVELTSERTATTGLQLKDIDSVLEEITDPHRLGMFLNIEPHKLEKFEKNYLRDIDRQKSEVIKYWLRNSKDCSWEVLANAVEEMGGHGNLVKRLRDMHPEVLKTATKQVQT